MSGEKYLKKTAIEEARFKGSLVGCFKQLPLIGNVVDIMQTVQDRVEAVSVQSDLSSLKRQMNTMPFRMLRLFHEYHVEFLASLSNANMSSNELAEHLRGFREMQRCGWQPFFFEDLVSERQQLRDQPQAWGRVLYPEDTFDADSFPLLLNLDKPRILEVNPPALTQLLSSGGGLQSTSLILPEQNQILAVESPPAELKTQGEITKLHPHGYGFINGNIFFHKSSVEDLDFQSLKKGQSVMLRFEEGEKGLRATEVRLAERAAPQQSTAEHPTRGN